MKAAFRILVFLVIWGSTFAATYWVWTTFGAVWAILFFLFGAGFAGFAGMLAMMGLAKLLRIRIDE